MKILPLASSIGATIKFLCKFSKAVTIDLFFKESLLECTDLSFVFQLH